MPRHHLLDSGSDIWGAVSYPSMLSRSWVIDDAIDDGEQSMACGHTNEYLLIRVAANI